MMTKSLNERVKLVKSKKTNKEMNKIVLSGKRPCNGHKDECTPSQN